MNGILGRAATLVALTSDGTATGKNKCKELYYTMYVRAHAPIHIHVLLYFLSVAGEDYSALSVDIAIPAGETEYQVEVPLIDDEAVERDERFSVSLSTTDPALLISTEVARATIKDDDRKAKL